MQEVYNDFQFASEGDCCAMKNEYERLNDKMTPETFGHSITATVVSEAVSCAPKQENEDLIKCIRLHLVRVPEYITHLQNVVTSRALRSQLAEAAKKTRGRLSGFDTLYGTADSHNIESLKREQLGSYCLALRGALQAEIDIARDLNLLNQNETRADAVSFNSEVASEALGIASVLVELVCAVRARFF